MRNVITLPGNPNIGLAQMSLSMTLEQPKGILDAGASIEDRTGPNGRILLLRETTEDRRKGVQMALERGASIACMDEIGDTQLAHSLRTSGTAVILPVIVWRLLPSKS